MKDWRKMWLRLRQRIFEEKRKDVLKYMDDLENDGCLSAYSEIPTDSITVWRFYDAPEKYRRLAPTQDDADWLAFIPKPLENEPLEWLSDGSLFGPSTVISYGVKDGQIRVGYHS